MGINGFSGSLRTVTISGLLRFTSSLILLNFFLPELSLQDQFMLSAVFFLPMLIGELLLLRGANNLIIYGIILVATYTLTYYLPVVRWHYIIPVIWSIPNILNIWVYEKSKGNTAGLNRKVFLVLLFNVIIYSETFVVTDLFMDYLDGYFFGSWESIFYALIEDYEPILAAIGLSNALGVAYILNSMKNRLTEQEVEERRKQGKEEKIMHDIQLGEGNVSTLANRYGVSEDSVSNLITSAQEEGIVEGVYHEGDTQQFITDSYVKQVIRERLLMGSPDPIDITDGTKSTKPPFDEAWRRVTEYAGAIFYTKTGYPFTYTVEDDAVKTSRTSYTLYRDQFEKAYNLAPVKGPGEYTNLVRGPSYIWAILHDERIRRKQW
jgi:hypothetical protein